MIASGIHFAVTLPGESPDAMPLSFFVLPSAFTLLSRDQAEQFLLSTRNCPVKSNLFALLWGLVLKFGDSKCNFVLV